MQNSVMLPNTGMERGHPTSLPSERSLSEAGLGARTEGNPETEEFEIFSYLNNISLNSSNFYVFNLQESEVQVTAASAINCLLF